MIDQENQIKDNYFFDKYGKKKIRQPMSRMSILALIIVVFAICYWLIVSAPGDFPKNKTVSIPSGTSLSRASAILEQSSIIRSPLLFRLMIRFFAGQSGVKAGDYLFENPQNVITVAKRLTDANRGFAPFAVLIPEGKSAKEISEILGGKIPNFNKKEFLKIATKHEGYLFPDTYNFVFDITPNAVLDAMLLNFNDRI